MPAPASCTPCPRSSEKPASGCMLSDHHARYAALLTLTRRMKNPEKLAASTKQPKYPVYEEGGKIVWIRPGGCYLGFSTSCLSGLADSVPSRAQRGIGFG